ncbi:hypothetical protein [Tessaracoccus defluvii]|uniref:DUF4230 domain-containing protein n=1 Tax=Tessaracoccus defluvii TaxID=1285901 RepID=A0A7H0H233_9ACTN|nr:hypothetical protein [Tessaracoccus defluvii]QNP54599.1 hypothetical protein H9L22_09630 [Tessaracoccus defluvii]
MKKAAWIGIVAVAIVIAFAGGLVGPKLWGLAGWGTSSESHDRQVIAAVQRTEEIALVSLGIEGILDESKESTFLGVKVPGSKRLTLMQYGFTAKLGVDGAGVRIEPADENTYEISFPEFIFIGFDDPTFKVAAEDNGILSWATPEIDSLEMVNKVLTDDAKSEYIVANEELLQEQATTFYTSILRAVDPDIELTFVFRPAT